MILKQLQQALYYNFNLINYFQDKSSLAFNKNNKEKQSNNSKLSNLLDFNNIDLKATRYGNQKPNQSLIFSPSNIKGLFEYLYKVEKFLRNKVEKFLRNSKI